LGLVSKLAIIENSPRRRMQILGLYSMKYHIPCDYTRIAWRSKAGRKIRWIEELTVFWNVGLN